MEDQINPKQSIADLEGFECYVNSQVTQGSDEWLMARKGLERFLVTSGDRRLDFQGSNIGRYRVCPLTNANNQALRKSLPYLNPTAISSSSISFGMGDRLGRATVGHLAAIEGTAAQPVIAQQSVRELTLTGRTFADVLADAVWGVFQSGYKGLFGADGDHLKTREAVADAIQNGYTMITLDCSEKIHNDVYAMSKAQRSQQLQRLPAERIQQVQSRYLNHPLPFGTINEETLIESVLVYSDAVQFAQEIYHEFLANRPDISFEVSIDETDIPTTLFAHYFVANELIERHQVHVVSMAPRFVGKFQKGIDYIGRVEEFEDQLIGHQIIADQFGYKISFHSGSDKFSIFPSAARITKNRYHVKTAGTSWLEFTRMISMKDTDLFRKIYEFSLAHLDIAKKSYHVDVTTESCPKIDSFLPLEYPLLLQNDNARQLLHINYGNVLQYQVEGKNVLKQQSFNLLDQEEDSYHEIIRTHFQKHLQSLGIVK